MVAAKRGAGGIKEGEGEEEGVKGCWRGFSAPTLLQLKLCNATPRKYTSHTQMVLVGGEGGRGSVWQGVESGAVAVCAL